MTITPQYLKDADGKTTLAILPVSEFDAILEELQDQEDVRFYDAAKKQDNGQRIYFLTI